MLSQLLLCVFVYIFLDKLVAVCSMEWVAISGPRSFYFLWNGFHFLVPSLLWSCPETEQKTCAALRLWEQPMNRAQWSWKTRQFGQSDGNNEKSIVMLPESNLQGGESEGKIERERDRELKREAGTEKESRNTRDAGERVSDHPRKEACYWFCVHVEVAAH